MTQFIRTASAWILMIALIVVVIAANSVYTIHTLNELAAVEGRAADHCDVDTFQVSERQACAESDRESIGILLL